MRKIFYAVGLLGWTAIQGCSSEATSMPQANASSAMGHATKAAAEDLKKLKFDYPKDPKCGAPLSAGLEDSTEYKGKLYGFCSKECKDAFLASPESFLAHIVTP